MKTLKWVCALGVLSSVLFVAGCGGTNQTPLINILLCPPYGFCGQASGLAVVPANEDFRVAVYIKVAGVWWSKPYGGAAVAIADNGTWSADICTGGDDAHSTEVMAYLIPASVVPPECASCDEPPFILLAVGSDRFVRVGAPAGIPEIPPVGTPPPPKEEASTPTPASTPAAM